jgi:hypothetical protein
MREVERKPERKLEESSAELGKGGVWCGFEGRDGYPRGSMLLINF